MEQEKKIYFIAWLIFGLGNRVSQVLGNTNLGEVEMPVEIAKYITRGTLETCHYQTYLFHG